MNVLVISHSAIQPTYHRKFEEIARYGDVCLRVLVPETWVENTQVLHISRIDAPNLSYYPGKVTFPGYGSRFFFTEGITEHFREFKPDIIHLEEEPWSLCALQTVILKRRFCPRSKLIFRTSLSISAKQKLELIASLIEKITFRESSCAFILSKRAGEILAKKGYRKGMKVSPNGVDERIFKKMDAAELRQKLGIKKDGFVIGYTGRLMRMKGLDTLLRAFSMLKYPSCHLLIVGSGEYKEEMLAIASQLGIYDKMIFAGAVSAKEVPKYVNCMDVLVLPSITTPGWVEFFGRVLVEAMMCEVPVIGSSSGEIPNVICDAGLIFQEKDEKELSDKLTMIIEDSDLRRSLISRGLSRASSLFTWESIARDTYDIYCLL